MIFYCFHWIIIDALLVVLQQWVNRNWIKMILMMILKDIKTCLIHRVTPFCMEFSRANTSVGFLFLCLFFVTGNSGDGFVNWLPLKTDWKVSRHPYPLWTVPSIPVLVKNRMMFFKSSSFRSFIMTLNKKSILEPF